MNKHVLMRHFPPLAKRLSARCYYSKAFMQFFYQQRKLASLRLYINLYTILTVQWRPFSVEKHFSELVAYVYPALTAFSIKGGSELPLIFEFSRKKMGKYYMGKLKSSTSVMGSLLSGISFLLKDQASIDLV